MTDASCARAHANIALAKYWGKADAARNIPAVPSVSVTLEALTTTTSVQFDPRFDRDEVYVNGDVASAKAAVRVVGLLDRVRDAAGISMRARVISQNNFPTASGLASSASAFAALAVAAVDAAGLDWGPREISDLARRSSASAARSVYGGFVYLDTAPPGALQLCAKPLFAPFHWPLCVVIAIVSDQPKSVGSTDGMNHTALTSPYYDSWRRWSPSVADRVVAAIERRDFDALAAAAEQSALAMHACAMAADPAVLYFEPASIALWHRVRELRSQGLPVFATMDAGPNLKAITTGADASRVATALRQVPGVRQVITSHLGGDACLLAPGTLGIPETLGTH